MRISRHLFCGLFGALVCVSAYQDARAGDTTESKPVAKLAPEFHDMSLFSFMQRYGKRGRRDSPVLVTVRVAGTKGAEQFCNGRPRVRDAVLGVLSFGRAARQAQGSLDRLEPPLMQAVSRALPSGIVKTIKVKGGRSPADFTNEITQTNDTCNGFKE